MFAHLHCHFFGSYSDSLLEPERAADYVRGLGQRSLAITDHGELAFWLPFYRACRSAGIHPVFGCEVYFVADAARSIELDDPYRNHLILLARNNEGFSNLIRLINDSHLENSFRRVRGLVDWKLLQRYHRGLTALSGCFWGSVPQKYLVEGAAAAEAEAARYRELFGEDFYLELGRHGIPDEEKANRGLIELAERRGYRPVVTNDCHYYRARDWMAHDVLIKTRFGYPTEFTLDARNYYLKSEEEMRRLGFPGEYLDRTEEIAESCRVNPGEGGFSGDGAFDPDREAVFSSRLEIIGPGRALAAVSSVLKIGEEEVRRLDPVIGGRRSLSEAVRAEPAVRRLKEEFPLLFELAEKLEGVPRSSSPDYEKIIGLPLSRARRRLPLKRSEGAVMVQYPSEEVERIGVGTIPTVDLRSRSESFVRRAERSAARAEARRLLGDGDGSAGRERLEEILAAEPRDREAARLLADSFFSSGRWKEALEWYSRLDEAGADLPRRALLRTRKGWALWRLGRRGEALEAFGRAAGEDDYPAAHYALGVVNFQSGRLPEAARHLNRLLEVSPEGKRAEKARRLLSRCRGFR